MSYGDRDADLQRRSRVASELDRREFWKDCFKVSLEYGQGVLVATEMADASLSAFESKFMREVK